MFKILCCLALLVTLCHGASIGSADATTEKKEIIPVLRFETDKKPDGSFSFMYEGGDHSFREESGVIENAGTDDEALEVSGSYRYIDADGREVEVHYTAGKNGFVPVGTNILSEISALAKAAADLPQQTDDDDEKEKEKQKQNQRRARSRGVEKEEGNIKVQVVEEKKPLKVAEKKPLKEAEKKPIVKKPEENKKEEKKPEEKKVEAKKPEEKKVEDKKPEEKKPEDKKPEQKKTEEKKTEEKKPEEKKTAEKVEAKKPEEKKVEKPAENKASERKPAAKAEEKKADSKTSH